ncbi:MAG: hypothetical protein SGJ19_21410 [Planctomycetia bacterium]|nr:hypothetical protein [Planctomycetia bacterium]
MDSFRMLVALGPLAIYLLLLGLVNLLPRPYLTTGGRDTAALGVALSGFILIGPLELFMPHWPSAHWSEFMWVFWLLLGVLCTLVLTLIVLSQRPRLVIYNISADELRPVLAEAAELLDADARWAGGSLALPRLKVHLHVEPFPGMRNVTLAATTDAQDLGGWRALEQTLAAELTAVRCRPNPLGGAMAVAAVLLLLLVSANLVRDPQALTQGFWEMLRM